MSTFYFGNRFLSEAEMTVNAKYIHGYLTPRGWSLNAISAMLGNMQSESSINPAIWQNLDEGNTSLGYGLVQWTPATKFLHWCDENGLDDEHMDSALMRIEYELENGLQWIATDAYPMSFSEFKTSNLAPSYLALAFLNNYERPADRDQPNRGTQAESWAQILRKEGGGSSGGQTTVKTKNMPLWLKFSAIRRRI